MTAATNEQTGIQEGRAVLYLRVSTPGQVRTDYDPEGISLPAQRKACQRKAEQLGLAVVGEYVEAGVSGRGSEHCLEFQKMLARIKTAKDVDHVIVHNLSRLARNRIDEALVMDQFNRRHVTLVSATEPIDNTPESQFMQGILSAMAQFRSQQDGEDVAYKMGEKAKNGGTIGKAPIGYLNVREKVDGHEVRAVAVDGELGPFIRAAFEMYRDGKTIQAICDELGARGFLRPAMRNHPAAPLTDGAMGKLLRNPYYLGYVRYKGELYPGRQPALVDRELFDQVQTALSERGPGSPRHRIHDHLLKGMLWCGECHDRGIERRMILNKSRGKAGGVFWHYFCNGRTFATDRHEHAPYIQTGMIERAVARYYRQVGFTQGFIAAMEQGLERATAELDRADGLAKAQSARRLAKLKTQEERLVQLAADGDLPRPAIREKIARIQLDRDAAEQQLDSLSGDARRGAPTSAIHCASSRTPPPGTTTHWPRQNTRRRSTPPSSARSTSTATTTAGRPTPARPPTRATSQRSRAWRRDSAAPAASTTPEASQPPGREPETPRPARFEATQPARARQSPRAKQGRRLHTPQMTLLETAPQAFAKNHRRT